MKNTFEQQIYEIFGTTDPKELRRLSKDAKQYQQLAKKEALRHAAGRKPAFSLPQIIQMAAMQQQGKSIAEIFGAPKQQRTREFLSRVLGSN